MGKKFYIYILMLLFIGGCETFPGGGRPFSDYYKVHLYHSAKASMNRVWLDFGHPDVIDHGEEGEVWTYYDRVDGKTFVFYFDDRRWMTRSAIIPPEKSISGKK